MERVYRIDRQDAGTLRPPRRLADGRLIVDAFGARAGIQEYYRKGKWVRELRHPDDVFDAKSLETFRLLPVTNRHPPKLLKDRKQIKQYMVGAGGEAVERVDDKMRVSLMIGDDDLAAAMERGDQVEISAGYTCELDETPGHDPVYGRYDARQRNIVGNHWAVVEEGRAGPEVRARMDEVDPEIIGRMVGPNLQWSGGRANTSSMDLETQNRALSAKVGELEAKIVELEAVKTDAVQRADAADGKLEIANKQIDGLKVEVAARMDASKDEAVSRERTRADKAEASLRQLGVEFPKAIRARAALQTKASAIMGMDFRMDDMTDRQIRNAVVKRLDATVDVGDAVPDGKVEGLFEALTEGYIKNARQLAAVGEYLDASGHKPREVVEPVNHTAAPSRRDLGRAPLPSTTKFRITGKE